MKKTLFAAGAALVFLAASCASLGSQAGSGVLYTDVTTGEAVTSNPLGKKVGTAKAINVLGAVAIGDASISAAAKAGGIKRVSHVDSKKTSVLGIFGSYKVMVYGE